MSEFHLAIGLGIFLIIVGGGAGGGGADLIFCWCIKAYYLVLYMFSMYRGQNKAQSSAVIHLIGYKLSQFQAFIGHFLNKK